MLNSTDNRQASSLQTGRMSHRLLAILALAVISFAQPVHASIVGFGDFSNFSVNQADADGAPVLNLAAQSIRLTGQSAPESRSIFNNTPQPITSFTASFTYQAIGSNPPVNEFDVFGACFIIQNSASGPGTVMPTGPYGTAPNRFGYGPTSGNAPFLPPVYDHSVALSLERGVVSNGPPFSGFSPTSASGLYSGGVADGNGTNTTPFDIFSGHPINVTLTYNGSILSETLTDTVTSGTFSQAFPVNIPSLVGSTHAYVGFSASTAINNVLSGTADQASLFSNFQFTAVPEPGSLFMAGTAAACLIVVAGFHRRRRERP